MISHSSELPVEKRVAADGSRKYRFPLESGLSMEAAFFEVPGRARPLIACVSTQVGCAVGCPFCAATREGFFRNLSAEEIVREVDWIVGDVGLSESTLEAFEISFMGMGEPLANLRALLSALDTLHARYPGISRVSVSTAGPARRIDALTAAMPVAPPVHLQISLHATTDELRRRLVPNAPESIDRLLEAGARYHRTTGDQVCLNYILFRGLNDSAGDARRLAALDPEAFYVKVTALNAVPGLPDELVSPTLPEMLEFCGRLQAHGMPHKIFVGDGLDVQASCGQLAARPTPVPPPHTRARAAV